MPSADSARSESARTYGPIRLLDTSLGRQLLGFVLAFVGVQLVGWAVDGNTPLSPAVIYALIGGFAMLNGLFLGGVRPR